MMLQHELSFIPPVIAHRGASAYAPENTMAAFVKAVQLGSKWLELDVMLASCGTPIVFHDETLDRTTNGHGMVVDCSFAYLQTLDAGRWFNPIYSGERIPSLQHVLEFAQDNHLCLNVEIKPLPNQEAETTINIWQLISERYSSYLPHILFSSFSIQALRILRELSDSCAIGLLMDQWLPDWQFICDELDCMSVHINMDIVTGEHVRRIKSSNRLLLSYTVNEAAHAKTLFRHGVDAVFTDMPDRIIAIT